MTLSPPGAGSGGAYGSRPGAGPAAGGAPAPSGFISRYQILEKIGEGGMGALFLARDPAIDRLLAIKLLRRGFDTDELRARFAREAKAAGRLRHPNIVTIFDVGEHDGDPFIAMEFLAGETLDELIRHGARLSLARRLKLLEELCDGLSYAHRAGIVHRDVKPANLIVDSEGILKILDFGIVRFEEGGSTVAGMLVGTVNYMSPEQVTGGDIDHRSDIFAVGLVAYELLTSRQAFPGTMKSGLLNRIANVQYEPVATLLPQLHPDVRAIVDQALQREPADRYQDLAKMRNDLARVRQRIEAMEEQAVEEMMGDGGETALVTAPGLPTPIGGTPKGSGALNAAERALETGDYRKALTLAGRSAAADPRDPQASGVLARAEAALLERGRSLESSAGARSASGARIPSGVAARPAEMTPSGATPSGSILLPAVTPSGAVPPAAAPASGTYAAPAVHPLLWAAAGALVILVAIVAGVLGPRLFSQPGGSTAERATPSQERQTTSPPVEPSREIAAAPAVTPGRDTVAKGGRLEPAAEPQRGGAQRVETPAREAGSPPPSRSTAVSPPRSPTVAPAPALARAGRDVPAPRRTNYVEPQYPASALDSRLQGTVRVELTITRDGRVADARVVQSVHGLDDAALAAVRRWEFAPSYVGGAAVPVLHVVDIEFAPPARPSSPAAVTPPPQSSPGTGAHPPGEAPARETARPPAGDASASPPRSSAGTKAAAADAEGVRDALRRYEAAWEARDAAALARVQQLSGDELARVEAAMKGARTQTMELKVLDVRVEPDGRQATAVCSITRQFRPRIGDKVQTRRSTGTLTLERREDAWVITSIR